MSELLTHEEYKAIADGLTLASTAFVDGGFRKAASGETFDSIDPATGKLLAKVAACDAARGRSDRFPHDRPKRTARRPSFATKSSTQEIHADPVTAGHDLSAINITISEHSRLI